MAVSAFDQAFETDAAPLHSQWFGVPIRLRRNAENSAEFTAVWSAQEYQTIDHETGLAIVIRKRVYWFLKTEAVIGGVTITPRAGDEILDGAETLKILPVENHPAVEEAPGGYRWIARTDKLV